MKNRGVLHGKRRRCTPFCIMPGFILCRLSSGGGAQKQAIAIEVMTPLYLDGVRVSTLISSPEDVDVLAVGYCLAEGKVAGGRVLSDVSLHDGEAWVTTREGVREAPQDEPFNPISAQQLCSYGGLLDSLSTAHHASHGVHEGALVKGDEILVYTEDIGRHNVLDRLRGFVEMNHIDVSQAVLVFSGRVPQSVIEKVHGLGVRFLASRALPTSLGVALAEKYGITVVCGLRPDSFKVFAHGERIIW